VIGLDTNVLVRYLTQDDDEQTSRATEVVDALDDQDRGFVSLVVLVELHWVLRTAFRVSADESAAIVEGLLGASWLVVQESDVARRAVARTRAGVDFSDALVAELGAVAGCATTVTFDRRAARHPGMTLL
jgi:predicted nucleic-acid-binding protein